LIEITFDGSHVLIMWVIGVWRHILDPWCVGALRQAEKYCSQPDAVLNMPPNTDHAHNKHM